MSFFMGAICPGPLNGGTTVPHIETGGGVSTDFGHREWILTANGHEWGPRMDAKKAQQAQNKSEEKPHAKTQRRKG